MNHNVRRFIEQDRNINKNKVKKKKRFVSNSIEKKELRTVT